MRSLESDRTAMMPITGLTNGFGQPVQLQVPMWVFRPWEAQAQANHYQTLDRLRERGGLDAAEAVAILRGLPYQEILPRSEAHRQLVAIVNAALYYRDVERPDPPKGTA